MRVNYRSIEASHCEQLQEIVGKKALTEHHTALCNLIDAEAFERGEIALIVVDHPELLSID